MLRQSLSSFSLPFAQLTRIQNFHRGRRTPPWPSRKGLGSCCRSIPRYVTRPLLCPLPRPHHCSFTTALLLFGATLTIIVVTIRQRRRKRQQAEQPDFSYASHLPPKFLPSMPYGISRVSRSDGPSDSLGSYRYPLAAQFSVPTSSQVRSEEFSRSVQSAKGVCLIAEVERTVLAVFCFTAL